MLSVLLQITSDVEPEDDDDDATLVSGSWSLGQLLLFILLDPSSAEEFGVAP
jgi:hypothetical protein